MQECQSGSLCEELVNGSETQSYLEHIQLYQGMLQCRNAGMLEVKRNLTKPTL